MSGTWLVSTVVAVGLLAGTMATADTPAPVLNAVNRMAQSLNIASETVKVISFELVQWPDSSLGVRKPGMMYMQVITPGYKVILEGDGRRFEYHTNLGQQVVLADSDPEHGVGTVHPGGDEIADRAVGEACRADLAKRLNVPLTEISVVSVKPQVFPDASLGLARPGEMYAQVLTSGFTVLLRARHGEYLYTGTQKSFRYGGPVDSWRFSAVFLEPMANDANLNGNLMQISLAGTNPVLLLAGVSGYWPQSDGSIFAARRTSRSGHDLLHFIPGRGAEAVKVLSGLDFAGATAEEGSTRWAAVRRPRVGMPWELVWADFGSTAAPQSVALPDEARPFSLYWHQGSPIVGITRGEKRAYVELRLSVTPPAWRDANHFSPPEQMAWVLNRSESLGVETVEVDGKPLTKVSTHWFTGEEREVIKILGFVMKGAELSPGVVFLLLTGIRDGQPEIITVDYRTGEVMQTLAGCAQARLLAAPPLAWLDFEIAGQTHEPQ